jgi:diamine N-acetyltransferase
MLPTTTISVRVANGQDAPLIADLSRATFYDAFADANTKENMDKFLNEQFTRESLISEVTQPGNIFLLAEFDNEPAGYARLREDNNPPKLAGKATLEIARIYAVKKFIGAGVGSALMKRSIAIGRQLGKEYIWLGVWEKNERAIAFYRKWGFEKFGEHPFILGRDVQTDWLMRMRTGAAIG